MRHTLFPLTGLLLLLSLACFLPAGAQAAAVDELEATDSGAPTAIMMLPGGDKKAAGSMKPVVFNHLIHERKIEDCTVCHHTGDPQKCSDCHTLKGSEEGKYITLERAMHATNIAPRTDGPTPQSCVSCHEQQLKRRECAGCHSIAKPARDDRWCGVCHSVTSSMSAQQLQQAAAYFDGDTRVPMETGDRIEIRRAELDTLILKIHHSSFLEILSRKMSNR